MLKKLFITCIIFLGVTLSINTLLSPSVSAAEAFTGRTGDCNSFLGFTTWDCNVNISDENTLKQGIWQIAANIATDITVAAAYLVLGYVIYGGYLYSFSGGDPGKVASGKKTLMQAFIGLAIVMSANLIMGSIRIALVGSNGDISNCATGSCVDPGQMIENLIGWFTGIAGVISVVFLIFGGISYITSAGDPGKLKKAKDTIFYSLIGLAIVALAVAITAFVSNIIRNANNTSYLNETIISKELYEKTKIY